VRRGFNRTERIADLIQKALARILLEEMDDTRFRFVTITAVNVSKDISYAKVYVTLLLEDLEKIKLIIQALNRAANKMRYHLAQDVDLRIVPELKFVYDESTTQGFTISQLINAAAKQSGIDEDDIETPNESDKK